MSQPKWIDELATHADRREEIATEMLLAAVREAADRDNYRLLRAVVSDGGRTIDDLATVARMARLVVVERVGVMAQVGLIKRDIETGHVAPTPLASGLIGLLEHARSGFVRRIEEGVSRLLRDGR